MYTGEDVAGMFQGNLFCSKMCSTFETISNISNIYIFGIRTDIRGGIAAHKYVSHGP